MAATVASAALSPLRRFFQRSVDVSSGSVDLVVLVDEGAKTFLDRTGGVEVLLKEFDCSAILALKDDEVIDRLRFQGPGPSGSAPERIVAVVLTTCFLWDVSRSIRDVLLKISKRAPRSELSVRLCCSLSEQEHSLHPGADVRPPMNFEAFTDEFGASTPISDDISATHVPMNMTALVASGDVEAFALERELFPFLLKTLQAKGAQLPPSVRRIDDVEAQAVLSKHQISQVKLVAHTLASTLSHQLHLNVKESVWALGYTSALVGNSMVASLQAASDFAEQASLVIIDRTLDLSSPLRHWGAPIVSRTMEAARKNDFDPALGKVSLHHPGHKAAAALFADLARSENESTAKDAILRAFSGGSPDLAILHIAAAAKKCLDSDSDLASAWAKRSSAEKALAHVFDIDGVAELVAEVFRNRPCEEAVAFAAYASSLSGPRMFAATKSDLVIRSAMMSMLSKSKESRDCLTAMLRGSPRDDASLVGEVVGALSEIASLRQGALAELSSAASAERPRSLLFDLLLRIYGGETADKIPELEKLGGSALGSVAKSLLTSGFSMFGVSAPVASQPSPRDASSQGTLVVFFVGGVAPSDVLDASNALNEIRRTGGAAPRRILIGGTTFATESSVLESVFGVL